MRSLIAALAALFIVSTNAVQLGSESEAEKCRMVCNDSGCKMVCDTAEEQGRCKLDCSSGSCKIVCDK